MVSSGEGGKPVMSSESRRIKVAGAASAFGLGDRLAASTGEVYAKVRQKLQQIESAICVAEEDIKEDKHMQAEYDKQMTAAEEREAEYDIEDEEKEKPAGKRRAKGFQRQTAGAGKKARA